MGGAHLADIGSRHLGWGLSATDNHNRHYPTAILRIIAYVPHTLSAELEENGSLLANSQRAGIADLSMRIDLNGTGTGG